VGWRDVVYGAYERRVLKDLPREALPRHVAVMLDGNRRWARARGAGTASGHQAGADKIEELLEWCREAGVEYVTLWLLSTDNLRRAEEELAPLLKIIETAVADLAESGHWHLKIVGALDLLPPETAASLSASAERTKDVDGMTVNVAVGYGGRREIADAVRDLLLARAAHGETIEQIAAELTVEDIAGHLYTPLHQGPARPRPRHPHLG
jgi:short-chain Z-isoprenyl diphosphate synthase